jgi:CheY-like chemotaxis protein
MNGIETLDQTSTNDVQTDQCPTETATDANPNRQAIDSVFTILGFEKCFLDESHAPGKPNLRARTKSAPLILHVDDDVDLVDAVTSRLAAAGYRVASALDGVSGMQEALRHPANAIILDYDMPNGRGDVVVDLLKGNERTQDIPIIILTAVQQKHLKRTLLNKGADVFMTKPFEFSELQAAISGLLEGDDID